MRIVVDLQACQGSGRNRGIGRYSLSLVQAMARQIGPHHLDVVLNSSFPDSFQSICNSLAGLIDPSNIHYFGVPGPTDECDPQNEWRHLAGRRVREAFIDSLNPDVVHVSSYFEGYTNSIITSFSRFRPQCIHSATFYDLIPLQYSKEYLPNIQLYDWYHRKLKELSSAHLLLSISDSARREAIDVLNVPEANIFNISSAVNSIFTPPVSSDAERTALVARYRITKPYVMYTGGVDPRKNVPGLIRAFALLPDRTRREHQLVVVGQIDYSTSNHLHQIINEVGLRSDDVLFTGFVSDDDLVKLYGLTTVFVYPSFHEGFGLPALEAMSCGAPVLASNSTSLPEVVGCPDALFDPKYPYDIAKKIYRAITDEQFQSLLRSHGLSRAKQFSWNESARRAIDVFEARYEMRRHKRRTSERSQIYHQTGAPRANHERSWSFDVPMVLGQSNRDFRQASREKLQATDELFIACLVVKQGGRRELVRTWRESCELNTDQCVLITLTNHGNSWSMHLYRHDGRDTVEVMNDITHLSFRECLAAANVVAYLEADARSNSSLYEAFGSGAAVILPEGLLDDSIESKMVVTLPAIYSALDLHSTLVELRRNPNLVNQLATSARDYMLHQFGPDCVAERCTAAMESLARSNKSSCYSSLIEDLARIVPAAVRSPELEALAACVVDNHLCE